MPSKELVLTKPMNITAFGLSQEVYIFFWKSENLWDFALDLAESVRQFAPLLLLAETFVNNSLKSLK